MNKKGDGYMSVWYSKLPEEEIMRKFNNFMKKYGDKYTDYMREQLISHFLENVGERQMYAEFFQLYDHLKIIPENDNQYVYHLSTIKENFDISGNILEIGCGAFPNFGRRIAAEQKRIGKGTITVYDKSLVTKRTTKFQNMKLVAKEFTSEVSIVPYDLIVGIMPCLATDEIIEALYKTPKNFYIAFCGCDHFASRFEYNYMGGYWPIPSYNRNIEQLRTLCAEKDLGDLIEFMMPKKFDLDYPVAYNKRKIK